MSASTGANASRTASRGAPADCVSVAALPLAEKGCLALAEHAMAQIAAARAET